MVTAFVLLNVERGRINAVAETLGDVPGIAEVYAVAGRYDLVAVLRVKTNEALADLVTKSIRDVAGITHTETLIAFRAYSRHDLEAIFGRRGDAALPNRHPLRRRPRLHHGGRAEGARDPAAPARGRIPYQRDQRQHQQRRASDRHLRELPDGPTSRG